VYTYIVVDDEALLRRGMLKKISASGFGEQLTLLGEASNGEDGLKLIRSTDPDIIITDMKMPTTDGKWLLQAIQQDYPDKKIIVVSGYSDFEYMKEAISAKVVGYLLKPFNREEIRETLTKAIVLLEDERSALQRLEKQENEKEEIGYAADLQTLTSMILGLHTKEKLPILRSTKVRSLTDEHDYVLMMLITSNKRVSWNEIDEQTASAILIPHPQIEHIAFYLLCLPRNSKETISQADSMAKRLHVITGIGVSTVKATLNELHEAYGEAKAAINNRPIGLDSTKLSYFDPGLTEPSEVLQWNRTYELLFYIESGNRDKVVEMTLDWFDSMVYETLGQIKNACREFIREVRRIVNRDLKIGGSEQTSTSFDSVLEGMFEVGDIKEHLLHLLSNIAVMMKEQSIYSSSVHVIDNIKIYIQNNYDQVLSLEKISSLFFLNPSYCSFLFKEKTGINFSDYVNQVRVGHAKSLLQSSNEKVYKIARMLGFDNVKYFFRVFKKLTGQTPEEYRLHHTKT